MQAAEFVNGKKWTQNGYDLLELMRSNQLVATATHGEANRQCWAWLSPSGARHRLDYIITHQTDADHGKVRVDCRMPVGLSGFRDHRPLVARVCTRARWKKKQPGEEKLKRWDRALVEREYNLLLNWERAAQKGQDAPSTKEPMFLRLRREINRVVHSSLTTPDIEAEIVKRALDTCCTAPQRQSTNTLRLPAEILALVEQKQRFLQRWRGARRLCEKEQLSSLVQVADRSRQRSSARIQEEETGGLCWRSGTGSLPRRSKSNMCNGQTISSGPGTAQSCSTPERRITDVGATMVRLKLKGAGDASVTISGAEPLSLEAEPQLPQVKTWIPPRDAC